jgi:hypothetical protein
MLLMASTTALGLKVREWLELLVLMRERQCLFNGQAFCNENGEVIQMAAYEEAFYSILNEMQDQTPGLIGPDIDIEQIYGFYRSFRHGMEPLCEQENRVLPKRILIGDN